MYAADLKYVTGTDQLHISIFKMLVINENVNPKYLYSFFFVSHCWAKPNHCQNCVFFCVIFWMDTLTDPSKIVT